MSTPRDDHPSWFVEEILPHEPAPRAWLVSKFGPQCEVDDLIQETYARILRSPTSRRADSSKAFLFATARNLAIDQLRHRGVLAFEPITETADSYVVNDEPGVGETVSRRQELELLTAAIQSLPPTALVAGQQATVDAAQPLLPPVVTTLTPAQIDQLLAWQGVRLIFDDLPLSAVVAEFNLRNRQQLVITDSRITGLRVAGSFRADNVEAYSLLLEASFGVAVERRADGTTLLRREG